MKKTTDRHELEVAYVALSEARTMADVEKVRQRIAKRLRGEA